MEKPPAESFKQLTISVEKLPSSMGRNLSYSTARARLLLGCYRTGDANDPETYVAAIAATLARFPQDTITAVTHPVSGLPSRLSWLPTVKEVRNACEAETRLAEQIQARDRRIAAQLEERAREDARQRPRLTPTHSSEPGRNANLFVPADHARYTALLTWSETYDTSLWKLGKSSDGRDGMWIGRMILEDFTIRVAARKQEASE